MNIERLLQESFSLRDGLSAHCAQRLGTASQLLDTPVPPLRAASVEEGRKARHAFRRGMAEAVRLAAALIEESAYDLQVFVVLLRGLVLAEGDAGCGSALALLEKLLGEPWQGLERALHGADEAPATKSRRRWARQLDAVFDQIYDHLARRAAEASEGRVSPELEPDELARWPARVERLGHQLEARDLRAGRWDAARDLLVHHAAALEPSSVEAPAVAASQPAAADQEAAGGGAAAAPPPRAPAEPARVAVSSRGAPEPTHPTAAPERATVRVSARYWELSRRLVVFAELLEHEQFEKASLVASQLQAEIDSFDVAAFFPDLFADYFEASAQYAEELSMHAEQPPGLRTQSLLRLLQTDLERFVGSGRRGAGSPSGGEGR